MFDYLEFRPVEGKPSGHDLRLFVLTTCTHCALALRYLQREGLAYRLIYGDELPLELKRRLRNDFARSFHAPVRYPSLVVDETRLIVGFEQAEWVAALGQGQRQEENSGKRQGA